MHTGGKDGIQSTMWWLFIISKECSERVGDNEDEEDFDWQVEQEIYTEKSEEELRALQKYGFGNQRCGVFARLQVRSMDR